MPRNSSGVYTLPSGNPVIPGTTIDAAWANDTMEDMANEITNSLSRTGAGGMLAPFRIANGTVTAPGISYLNETNTGLYRSGAGSVWMSVLGVNTAQFSTVGLTIPFGKALTAQGNASVAGTFTVAGATTLASTLAVTGALSATGGVLGNITAASGTSTFHNVTINGDLDMNAGSSGTITNLPNPTNSGDAANKAYVDSQVATRLALTGGTMTGAIAMSNNKVTGLATPTADQDAATKAYVDSVAQGIDAKASCAAATVGNVTLSGTQTIDGYALTAGQRVLVKDQSAQAENGIYVVAAGSWARASDANTWDKLVAAFTFIEHGATNANNGYICTIPVIGTLGTTPVTWAQFSGAGQINAGTGMTKNGNTLNVNTASSARIVVGADEIDLATTGVIASTYRSVTVDAYGRVTSGTNPTTLAGYSITDAYTQTQTDTLLATKLSTTGGTMSGALAMGTNKITGLGDPTNPQDAATKSYIDTIFGSTATAAASAAAAASSASAASASATSASGSASAAAASATSAAASFDSFDDRYLGAKASDPTTDNDGNPLLTGALYWNSTVGEMRVYNGTSWVAAYLPAAGYLPITGGTLTGPTAISVNSASNALSITQVGSGNALYIEDVAADATPFVVSSTGVVGIGTTTPDNVTSAGMALVSNNGFFPQIVQRNKSNDTTASYLVFDKDRAGAIVQNGDALGAIVWRSFDGSNYLQSSAIIGYSDGTPGTNDVPGRLAFFTTSDGAASPTERLSISNTGAWGLSGSNYGTSGQVLTSAGAGAAPTWTNISVTPAAVSDQANTSTGYFDLPVGTTAQRPASPASGMIRVNTTTDALEIYSATKAFWYVVKSLAPSAPTAVEALIVAGGGGGGSYRAGGGGAGGLVYNAALAVSVGTTYTVTVGAGGAGGTAAANGVQGSTSTFISSATGGGFGAGAGNNGGTGGSGGGAASTQTGGAATSGQGFAGGNGGGFSDKYGAGGGGGAGGAGSAGTTSSGGAGGVGASTYSSLLQAASAGENVGGTFYIAGGGAGGGIFSAPSVNGGDGGGGDSPSNSNGTAGSANMGGGGGGANSTDDSTQRNGGAGGSGIVIIRYPDSFTAATATTGSPTYTVSGGFRIYKFTASGSITF